MDPVRNPFAPGAGSQPPELAGRDEIISDAEIALQRVLLGRHDASPPHYPVIFAAVLAAVGLIVGYQVNRLRVLSRYYESRRVP